MLYGVTERECGVSTIVSVRFDEAAPSSGVTLKPEKETTIRISSRSPHPISPALRGVVG